MACGGLAKESGTDGASEGFRGSVVAVSTDANVPARSRGPNARAVPATDDAGQDSVGREALPAPERKLVEPTGVDYVATIAIVRTPTAEDVEWSGRGVGGVLLTEEVLPCSAD